MKLKDWSSRKWGISLLVFGFGSLGQAYSELKIHHPGTHEKKAPVTPELTNTPPNRPRPTALSREAASFRSKHIGRISYVLWFGLDAEREDFEGRTVVNFEIKPKSKDLGKKIYLDFEEGNIRTLSLNGKALNDIADPGRFDGHHIYFQANELLPLSNRVEISYSHSYSKSGNGLHRFKDPVDGKIYLYSNFEPYSAHRMFPCFDQPDLKASYELTVEAPNEWTVISNTLPREASRIDGRKSWAFPPSQVFSTYVFALHAGPYASWKSNANGIPIRLFSRKSLAKYVDHQEWLNITQKGLDFFGVQFGYPYPFAKYDQIIVPDFNAGAMENVGAVTFSERFIYRTKVTDDRHRQRANTILHEMAHMWFGDLVTMQWWNGLWLNESFATFMAATAVDQATHFAGSWQSFYANVKQWAYWEDQLVTTHPIDLSVSDTDAAQATFDGITYGKGAATLKQLSFYLEEDDFREGLQRYFQKFAFRNTTVNDFIKMLSEASSQDLTKWQHVWLQTSGVNTIQTVWACETDSETEKAKISKFELLQKTTGEAGATSSRPTELRPHRTQIALFNFPKGQNKENAPLLPGKIFDVTYSGAQVIVPEAIGKPCPDMVFPNYRDYDYIKVELDPVSLKHALKHIAHVPDTFTRQMIWHSLWEMVVDGKIRAQDYADTVLHEGTQEKDTQVLSKLLHSLVDSSANRPSVLKFLTGDLRARYHAKIETFIRTHLQLAPAGSDQQLIWYQSLLDIASSPSSIQYVRAVLNGKQKLKGFVIDQEHRWELIETLARNGAKDAQELIVAELKTDGTDIGQKYAIAAEALIPDVETKGKWLNQILKLNPSRQISAAVAAAPSPAASGVPLSSSSAPAMTQATQQEALPLAKIREAMGTYQILGQENFTKSSVEPFFENLPKIALSAAIEDEEYSRWLTRSMYPSLCDASIIQKTTALLEKHPNLPASVIKSLKVGRQEEERCIRARERSLAAQ